MFYWHAYFTSRRLQRETMHVLAGCIHININSCCKDLPLSWAICLRVDFDCVREKRVPFWVYVYVYAYVHRGVRLCNCVREGVCAPWCADVYLCVLYLCVFKWLSVYVCVFFCFCLPISVLCTRVLL